MNTLTRYRDRLKALRADEAGMTPAQMIVTLIGMAIIAAIGIVAIMALIPWFQDGAAERETDSVAVAQESWYGMYGANEQQNARYADLADLTGASLLDATWEDKEVVINEINGGVDSGWEVFVRSSSDSVAYNSSERGEACILLASETMPSSDTPSETFSSVSCIGD